MNEFLGNLFFLSTLVTTFSFFGYQLPIIKKQTGKHFQFLNQFPYELLDAQSIRPNPVGGILLGLMVLMPSLYFVIQSQTILGINRWVMISLVTMMTLSRSALFYIHPTRLQLFLVNTTVHFTTSTMFYGFIVMLDLQEIGIKQGLMFAFFLAHFFVLFHPRLMRWSELEQEGKEKPSYIRPKLFILAFLQWFFIFGIVVYVVLQHLMMLI